MDGGGNTLVGIGMLVLAVGEILKITIVERIFHIGRDKLLTIKAFALVYNFVWGWLTWIQALPSWRAVKHSFDDFIQWARKLNHDARARSFRYLSRSVPECPLFTNGQPQAKNESRYVARHRRSGADVQSVAS